MSDSPAAPDITKSPLDTALADWVKKRFDRYSKGRWAEEREWFQAGLFYQMKQWLEKDGQNPKVLVPMKIEDNRRYPMPVSDHFSKTINTNAGYLGAALPSMQAMADNYDAKNRRAAEAAENAIDAANEESGMNILNPTLAKRVILFGLGVTKDTVAFDHSTDEVPVEAQPQAPAPPSPAAAPPQPQPETQTQDPDPTATPGADPGAGPGPQVVGMENLPAPRLKTELPMIFQVFLPRDTSDANLAKTIIERPRMSIGEAKELYPHYASKFVADDCKVTGTDESLAAFFMARLRSLAYASEQTDSEDKVTLTECWTEWSELGEKEQKAIAGEWESEPSAMYPQMSRLQAAVQYGLFVVLYKDDVVDKGENPWKGDKPYTFFPYEKDPASIYCKSLATSLVPLQKQLNRYKSLLERAMMSNGSVKLLWPTTQNSQSPPTGDPVDVTYWDPVGEGKVKPEYFAGRAIDAGIYKMIEMVLSDFTDLGYTNEVAEGEMPGSGTAFRALAYLGSKAEESRKPQRYLWEQAHEIRARKLLRMAETIWSNPRKIQTAGFNNTFGATEIARADLQGDYQLSVIQDSSRPKTLTEKMEVFQELAGAGMIDVSSPQIRAYVTDTLGVQDLDLTDNLQYAKAERDLEICKQGLKPQSNPFTNWQITFQTFSDYTLTEEYESSPPQIQAGVLAYAQWCQEMMMPPPVPGAIPPHPGGAQKQHKAPPQTKGGPGGQPASHVLGQVPGQTVSNQQVQFAAEKEGMNVVPNEVGAN